MKYMLCTALLLFSGNLYSCECMFHDISQHLTRADFVFLGEVIDKHDLCSLGMEKGDSHSCIGGPSVFLVEPYEVFKQPWRTLGGKNGGSYRRAYLVQDSNNCDIRFEVGEKYLIFSKFVTFLMHTTSRCHGTTLSGETETISKLRELISEADEKP